MCINPFACTGGTRRRNRLDKGPRTRREWRELMWNAGVVLRVSIPILLLHRLLNVPLVRPSNSFPNPVPPKNLPTNGYHQHRLLNYTPSATVVRLLTTNALIAYITSWVLYLSGASEDPRLLLPAWVSIATVTLPFSCSFSQQHPHPCPPTPSLSLSALTPPSPEQTLTFLYHLSHHNTKTNIRKETSPSTYFQSPVSSAWLPYFYNYI